MNQEQDGQTLLDRYYEERLEFNRQVHDKEKELREFKKRRNRETILPLMQFLEQRIPPHLKEKVLSRFSFTEQGESSLFELIEERTFASFGMLILRNIPLSDEELTQLNEAWKPVAGIDPAFRTFCLGSSELSRKLNKQSLDKLLEAGRKASGG